MILVSVLRSKWGYGRIYRLTKRALAQTWQLTREYLMKDILLLGTSNKFKSLKAAPDNKGYPHNIFLFLHVNICCGYSSEAPRRGASDEYPQYMLSWSNWKNISIRKTKQNETKQNKTKRNKTKQKILSGAMHVGLESFIYKKYKIL